MRRALLAAIALVVALPASAQQWPSKPVRFVVPFPAGGTTDIIARLLGERLSQKFGQQFVIENKAGAAGNIGAEAVAKADPDGHTILMGTIGIYSINQHLYPKLGFDAVKDFAPVSLVAKVANVLLVNPGVPVKTVQELVAYAKANPGKLNSGSPGSGSSGHLSTELFKMLSGADIAHVPYRGSAPMLTDLLGGQIQMSIDNLPSALPHIREGRLRALGVTTAQRWPATPDILTVAEQGVAGFEATAWFAVSAPAKTPDAIVQRLSSEIDRIIKVPEMAAKMREQGAEPVGGAPSVLADHARVETEKWAKVVKTANVKLD